MNSLFVEITLALILAGTVAVIVSFLRQPSIIAYIITGLILGPLGFAALSHGETLKGLSEIGITLLLFMVGLELDLTELKKIGRTIIIAGFTQIIVTTFFGFLIAWVLGFGLISAVYLGLALSFSSTIVIVKLLTEKKDLQSLYGKIALGIFVVQDIIAIFVLVFLQSSASTAYSLIPEVLITLGKLLILMLLIALHSRFIFPIILKFLSKSQELLLVFSLAWALGFASLVSIPEIGLNLAVGGFLAGVALANTAVHFEISAKIKPLRDFFIILFFIVLGSQISISGWREIIVPTTALSAFVIIGNPLIVLFILSLLGFKPRTAFFTSITVGQISEFSLILGTVGITLGHIGQKELSIITFVGIITITCSSYLIMHSQKIYEIIKHFLTSLDFKKGSAELTLKHSLLKNHCILVGSHRLGLRIIESLNHIGMPVVVIDFNPDIVNKLESTGVDAICGDINDSYIHELANIKQAKLIISTLPDIHDTLALIEALSRVKSKAKLIVTAREESEALRLYQKQADYVLLPHFIGADHLKHILENKHKQFSLASLRAEHLKSLTQTS